MSSDQWDIDVGFQQARFPIELNLPDASDDYLEDARQAVRREFRDSTKWKRLKCRVVTLISEFETGNVYALTVGHSVEFDWTWEGATAFRPLLMKEFEAISDYCRELIEQQGVKPSDICLLYNGKSTPSRLRATVAPRLADLGVELSVQTNKPFERSSHMLLVTTAHSFKGYDAEVVIIPAVDQYMAKGKSVLANSLYVAMTRARSILTLFSQKVVSPDAKTLCRVLDDCLANLTEHPLVESETSVLDDLHEMLNLIGNDHRKWLWRIWNTFRVSQEPLISPSGEVIAEPLFWFKADDHVHACFGTELPRQRVLQRLEDFGVELLRAGQEGI